MQKTKNKKIKTKFYLKQSPTKRTYNKTAINTFKKRIAAIVVVVQKVIKNVVVVEIFLKKVLEKENIPAAAATVTSQAHFFNTGALNFRA